MCLFLRAILVPFPHAIAQWRQIIIFISVLSMALGAVAAHRPEEHQAPDGL